MNSSRQNTDDDDGELEENLQRQQSTTSTSESFPKLSAMDEELERITHYQDLQPRVPGMTSWGVRCIRSPTLDQPDEFITDLPLGLISNVTLPHCAQGATWDIELDSGVVRAISSHDGSRMQPIGSNAINAGTALATPSLCHPHIHLDKAFLLAHPRYSHLQLKRGDFDEAMELTGEAKAQFTMDDLVERGQRLIDESVAAGVTHMRAFVEIDVVVGMKCLDAGIMLKQRAYEQKVCHIQLCAFAQLPLFSTAQGDTDGHTIRNLMEKAASRTEVDVLGSTPYVEQDLSRSHRNIEWMIKLALSTKKFLDFHLDYNLEQASPVTIWHVIESLKDQQWTEKAPDKTIVLGHCTRLTLMDENEWRDLAEAIQDLPIHFVGLPTSDLFMVPRSQSTRGTLDVPRMIKAHGINACIGTNNIGNAFTPYGSCDPLALASVGVGVYRAGTKEDAELMFECVSVRARRAIGLTVDHDGNDDLLRIRVGNEANLILFADAPGTWRARKSVSEVVYLYKNTGRRHVFKGRFVD